MPWTAWMPFRGPTSCAARSRSNPDGKVGRQQRHRAAAAFHRIAKFQNDSRDRCNTGAATGSQTSRSAGALTWDLPGPRIEHQARRLGCPIAHKGLAYAVAAIHEELVTRYGATIMGTAFSQSRTGKGPRASSRTLPSLTATYRSTSTPCASDHSSKQSSVRSARPAPCARSSSGPGCSSVRAFFRLLGRWPTLRCLAVKMRDGVIGHDARLGSRRVPDRRQPLEETILHVNLDAEAAELRGPPAYRARWTMRIFMLLRKPRAPLDRTTRLQGESP
jgi:hypothetical protein